MSVPEYRRKQSKFEVITRTRELATHTAIITSNENIFSRNNAWLVDKLNNCATDIYTSCAYANSLKLKDELRGELQADAAMTCKELITLIDLSQSVFHLRKKKVEYWSKIAVECSSLIREWIESDKKRLS